MNHQAPVLVWLRNDLRLHDHAAFHAAVDTGRPVLPVYCIDPRHFRPTDLGFAKMGTFRSYFLWESLHALKQALQSVGADLWVLRGRPENALCQLIRETGASHLFFHREIAAEERAVERALLARLAQEAVIVENFWSGFLFEPQQLPFDQAVPHVFSSFRKRVEQHVFIANPLPRPTKICGFQHASPPAFPTWEQWCTLTSAGQSQPVCPFQGGEASGLARINDYFWQKDRLKNYKFTRNGLLGDYASKLSPWLALGCLSPRLIHQEVRRYEQERHCNVSTYWLIFELIWRDFFRHTFMHQGNALFKQNGLGGDLPPVEADRDLFSAWCRGRTGVPFIDANMKELNTTGFMSNRGRQNVASFLIKDLRQPWRWGAAYFECMLVDYDVHSNWGNWAYVAGVGNDPRKDRYFHVLRQAEKYDSKGTFVCHWFPELGALPADMVHRPWLYGGDDKTQLGHFRSPIMDPTVSAERFYTWSRRRNQALQTT